MNPRSGAGVAPFSGRAEGAGRATDGTRTNHGRSAGEVESPATPPTDRTLAASTASTGLDYHTTHVGTPSIC